VTPPAGATVTGYRWSNNGVLDSIRDVRAGIYRVTVSLSNGCVKDSVVTINAPTPISIDTAASRKRDPKCPGDDNGEIVLIMKGGTSPYKYTWSGGQPTAFSVFSSLKAGTYFFTVTDFNNCQNVETIVPLAAPPDINLAYIDIEKPSCYGKCSLGRSDGKATVIASGGVGNTGVFTYQWSSGESTNQASQLCGGWQTVTISDGTCFKKDSVNIGNPDSIKFSPPQIVEPTCNGDRDGRVTLVVAGGSQPYGYTWSNGATTKDIINIPSGTYSVIVTDSKLCTSPPLSIEVRQPLPLRLDTIAGETNDVSCNGLSNGQITLKKIGGNSGFETYTWLGDSTKTNKAVNLKAGVYYITVTDSKGCTASLSHQIKQPDPIFFFFQPPAQPRCFGEQTFIKVDTAFGGTFRYPFSVSVDNGPQYPIGYQVPVFAEEHLITVTEQITGCSDTATVIISQPPQITIRFNNLNDSLPRPKMIVGLGVTNARIDPVVTSSLPLDSISYSPREFLISSNDSLRPFVKPLDDKTYKLRVTDVNGCKAEAEIDIELERNRNIYIPNIFSPNGDDKNDFFGVFAGVGVKKVNFVRIFDRWGELLFQAVDLPANSDPSLGWDGTFRSKDVNVGVYVYLVEVEFDDGQKLLYRGDINLVR
jgi:gliding motility-associated-like protein